MSSRKLSAHDIAASLIVNARHVTFPVDIDMAMLKVSRRSNVQEVSDLSWDIAKDLNWWHSKIRL